ncbi:MAG: hypothetical protein OXC60_20735 [Litoreibacter sp.]|nr:hypothetical protein [Litoreibacter sp.]
MRSLFKFLFRVVIALCLVLGVMLWFVMENAPLVENSGPPTPQDVKDARQFVRDLRSAINTDLSEQASFTTKEAELNSFMKLGARFIPGFRGSLSVIGDELHGAASVPVPKTSKWINIRAAAPEFEGGLSPSEVEVGPFSIPPSLALSLARFGGNAAIGNGFGDTVVDAVQAMRIDGDQVAFDLTMSEVGTNGIMRGVFGSLRGSEMPDASNIDRYYLLIREAMERGDLPTEGSYLPYITFTLEAARKGSATEGPANAYTSAIMALTLVCGAKDFTLVVGGMVGDEFAQEGNWTKSCGDLTLNDRIDSRRHFTTAAALQAASNRGFAVSVGEFKELYDTVKAGGFDFTDLAANNSGIRMSNTFMAAPAEDWPDLQSRIRSENDVIVRYDGIPQIMSGEDFEQQYGDVESAAYKDMLGFIENRISTLTLHQ